MITKGSREDVLRLAATLEDVANRNAKHHLSPLLASAAGAIRFLLDSSISSAQIAAHHIAVEHGWWETERNVPEMLCLMHSEISEALEEWREPKHAEAGGMEKSGHYRISKDGKPEGFYVELADCVIRILDLFEHDRRSLNEILFLKMEYNRTRPYRHGGKRG